MVCVSTKSHVFDGLTFGKVAFNGDSFSPVKQSLRIYKCIKHKESNTDKQSKYEILKAYNCRMSVDVHGTQCAIGKCHDHWSNIEKSKLRMVFGLFFKLAVLFILLVNTQNPVKYTVLAKMSKLIYFADIKNYIL